MKICFYNEQERIPVDRDLQHLLEQVIETGLALEQVTIPCEVSITFTDNEGIRLLNQQYRDKDVPTDVLSFPLLDVHPAGLELKDLAVGDFDVQEQVLLLGDIVISLERATEQAEEYGHSLRREAAFLTSHSLMHLLGYDHMTEEERAEMRIHEEAVLEKLSVNR